MLFRSADGLARRSLFLHTVLAVLLGSELTAPERAVLDKAITATYQRAGITDDPRTWSRPAPVLADLATVLSDTGATDLAGRLHPFTEGTHSVLFAGPTTTRPEGHLVVFSLRDLPDELKAIGTLLTLDAVWRQVTNPVIRRRRLVVVDEAWLLMRQAAGAEFLYRAAKAIRKHWGGLTLASQDALDFLGSDLGKAVVANAATQILMRQAPQAIDGIVRAFTLSQGQRQFLLSCERGQGLLSVRNNWVAFQAIASPAEHEIVTTDPEFLTSLDESDMSAGWVEL